MLPPKIKAHRVQDQRWKCPGHRAWVRSHACCVPGCHNMPIECAHIRLGAHAGVGQKPGDEHCISLCRDHHAESHRVGEWTFAIRHKINLQELAREFFLASPHRRKKPRAA